MRKVLSIVLALAMILGSFAFSFAATASDVVGEDCEDAVNVLTELGVVSGYPDGSFKPAGIVTRGEMAKIIICALGLEDYAAGSSSFSDMAGHWADKYVAYAVSLGIINGYPDNTFKANNTVSYDEAAKMLVAALGYTEDSLVGTWPANWVTKAKVLGILDDIKAGTAGANRGDIAIMTYQTLDQSIGKTNKDGDWVATNLGTVEDPVADIMLERLGAVLYDADGDDDAFAPGDAFVLDDTMADDAIVNVRNLVGAYVTAYSNDDDEIIAIDSIESVFLIGEFDVDTVAAATTFETDDEEYDIIGSETLVAAAYFTNGESDANGFGDADAGVLANVEYKIAADVSGVKIKDIYSVSEWAIDDDFQFEDGDLDDDNISGHDFTLDDNDDIDLSSFDLLGVANLEDIEEDDVVYVYLGATSGNITKLEVGTEIASGEVTRISSGDYTIGGKVYEFSTAAGAVATRPGIDDEIEMTLDYAGDIWDYEVISGEADLYGIVLRTGIASEDTTALGADDAEIELFMADGTEKTFVVDYDEIGTGAAFGVPMAAVAGEPEETDVYDKDVNGDEDGTTDGWLIAAGDVVEYDLNTDGEIEAIEWVVDASADDEDAEKREDVTWVADPADMTAGGYYQAFGVASDALIMTYETTVLGEFTTDEDDYGIAARAGLLDSEIPANAYYVVDSGIIVFMYIDDNATAADEVFGVVIDAEENSSDAEFGVNMLIDGAAVFKDSDVDATEWHDANFQNLYMIEYNTDGTVKALTPQTLVPAEKTGIFNSAEANVALDGTQVCDVSGDVVSLSTGTFNINGSEGEEVTTIATVTLNGATVYTWDATDGIYEEGSVSDIDGEQDVTFFDTKDDGAMVFDIVLVHPGVLYSGVLY